ncbi:MAG: type II toxin-antitoxin system VapC family toxin [Syntrophobacteraceae bacterium]|nr:type II toxin-antitoxin system VapC family toxin [Syntrophobacteraceae bacterium]
MNILLDTCTFLWVVSDSMDLSERARELFQDDSNSVFLSSVSAWEIIVKHALGRLPLPDLPERFIGGMRALHAIESLPLGEEAVLMLPRLPEIHRDPFDRMLVCQALSHGLSLLTPDSFIRQYPVPVVW